MGATAQCLVRRSSQGIELVSVADSGCGESVVVVLQGTNTGVQVSMLCSCLGELSSAHKSWGSFHFHTPAVILALAGLLTTLALLLLLLFFTAAYNFAHRHTPSYNIVLLGQ